MNAPENITMAPFTETAPEIFVQPTEIIEDFPSEAIDEILDEADEALNETDTHAQHVM